MELTMPTSLELLLPAEDDGSYGKKRNPRLCRITWTKVLLKTNGGLWAPSHVW